MSTPYAWHFHGITWAVLAAAWALVVGTHRRLSRRAGPAADPWGPRRIASLAGATAVAAVALTWPLADLAAHWSLTALVLQRLLLVLAVAPLVLLGLPDDVLARATRPAVVDRVLEACRHPAVAVAVCTVVFVGSMLVPVVALQSSSVVARGLVDLAVLMAGVGLWVPVLGRVPGITRLRPAGRAAYLVAQGVVPGFLSFIYIFARRPLYPGFDQAHRALGIQPVTDQQVAGFVSKLALLVTLLTVAAFVLLRAQREDEELADAEILAWADVERHFERVDRRRGAPEDPTVGPDGGAEHLP